LVCKKIEVFRRTDVIRQFGGTQKITANIILLIKKSSVILKQKLLLK